MLIPTAKTTSDEHRNRSSVVPFALLTTGNSEGCYTTPSSRLMRLLDGKIHHVISSV
jgi:hypothetical protein